MRLTLRSIRGSLGHAKCLFLVSIFVGRVPVLSLTQSCLFPYATKGVVVALRGRVWRL
jgi:hypothetical protein